MNIRKIMKIKVYKNGRIEEIEFTPFQKEILEALNDGTEIINISKNRQVGVSTALAYYCAIKLNIGGPGNNIIIKGHNQSFSQRLIKLIKDISILNYCTNSGDEFFYFRTDNKDTLRRYNNTVTTQINNSYLDPRISKHLILDEFDAYDRNYFESMSHIPTFNKISITHTNSIYEGLLETIGKHIKEATPRFPATRIDLEEKHLEFNSRYIIDKVFDNKVFDNKDIIKILLKSNINDSDFRKIVNILYGIN